MEKPLYFHGMDTLILMVGLSLNFCSLTFFLEKSACVNMNIANECVRSVRELRIDCLNFDSHHNGAREVVVW